VNPQRVGRRVLGLPRVDDVHQQTIILNPDGGEVRTATADNAKILVTVLAPIPECEDLEP
jgi:hypothetical protein